MEHGAHGCRRAAGFAALNHSRLSKFSSLACTVLTFSNPMNLEGEQHRFRRPLHPHSLPLRRSRPDPAGAARAPVPLLSRFRFEVLASRPSTVQHASSVAFNAPLLTNGAARVASTKARRATRPRLVLCSGLPSRVPAGHRVARRKPCDAPNDNRFSTQSTLPRLAMRTVNAETPDAHHNAANSGVWEISFALTWCVIRIELPYPPSPRAASSWQRRTEAGSTAAPREPQQRTHRRPCAANGWRP